MSLSQQEKFSSSSSSVQVNGDDNDTDTTGDAIDSTIMRSNEGVSYDDNGSEEDGKQQEKDLVLSPTNDDDISYSEEELVVEQEDHMAHEKIISLLQPTTTTTTTNDDAADEEQNESSSNDVNDPTTMIVDRSIDYAGRQQANHHNENNPNNGDLLPMIPTASETDYDDDHENDERSFVTCSDDDDHDNNAIIDDDDDDDDDEEQYTSTDQSNNDDPNNKSHHSNEHHNTNYNHNNRNKNNDHHEDEESNNNNDLLVPANLPYGPKDPSRNQILFENLNQTIESCMIDLCQKNRRGGRQNNTGGGDDDGGGVGHDTQDDGGDDNEDYLNSDGEDDDDTMNKYDYDVNEWREITKTCFAAIAIVFSSNFSSSSSNNNRNGGNTSSSPEDILDMNSVHTTPSMDLKKQQTDGMMATTTTTRSSGNNQQSHQTRLSMKRTISSLSLLNQGTQNANNNDDDDDDDSSNENNEHDNESYTSINEDDHDEQQNDENVEQKTAYSMHRPSIPLSVVLMLWKEMLQRRSRRESFTKDGITTTTTTTEEKSPSASSRTRTPTPTNINNNNGTSTQQHEDSQDAIAMSEENISGILERILHTLVNELSFIDVDSFAMGSDVVSSVVDVKECGDEGPTENTKSLNASDNNAADDDDDAGMISDEKNDDRTLSNTAGVGKDENKTCMSTTDTDSIGNIEIDVGTYLNTNDVQCIKINHDLHLLHGQYIAKEITKTFTFRHKKHGPPTKYRYSTGHFEDNPEIIMNAVMAAACSTCIDHCTPMIHNKQKLPSALQLQYEYSMEMLPWHLMRSLQYKHVMDMLLDKKFLQGRIALLDFQEATNVHISDVEELLARNAMNGHLKFTDILMADFSSNSYQILGELIDNEETSRIGKPIQEKMENRPVGGGDDDECEDKKAEDNFPELIQILEISKSIQSVGDSLLKYGLESDAMNFYYRALIRCEYVYSIRSSQCASMTPSSSMDKSDNPDNEETDEEKEDDGNSSEDSFVSSDADDQSTGAISLGTVQYQMGVILSRIASVYETQSTKLDSMLCYDRALSFYSRQQSTQHMEGVAKTLTAIGHLHLELNEYDDAISCFDESLSLWRSQEGDLYANEVANILVVIGTVRKEMGMFTESLDFFAQALYEKVLVRGKLHPEVGFVEHSLAAVYTELADFPKALSHFEEALRIRRSALDSVWYEITNSSKNDDEAKDLVKNSEIAVAETLLCIGTVYEACQDYDTAFTCLVENVSFHRSHLLNLAANQGLLMIRDVVKLMEEEEEGTEVVNNLFHNLTIALEVGQETAPLNTGADGLVDNVRVVEIENQLADLRFDIGMIHGARYFYGMKRKNDKEKKSEEVNEERSLAKLNLEESVQLRKKRVQDMETLMVLDTNVDNHEQIIIAFILYELGKLFSSTVPTENREDSLMRRSLFFTTRNPVVEEWVAALSYFEDARSILQENIGLVDTMDNAHGNDDPWAARLQKMPIIYEDMLQLMAILYRKLDEYDKSVECYNEVSILLTRMGLGDDPEVDSSLTSQAQNQMEKVATASQSIGDILVDTGEYRRALKSYDEALQLRRLQDSNSLEVAELLCCKGNVFLKTKEWGQAVLTFDEALRIRVDSLAENHHDIAACFHQIGKAYQGYEKFEQALDYFKKAQRILSSHSIEKDLRAADLFYDLGSIVLKMDSLSEHLLYTAPTNDDISLAFKCLTSSREIFMLKFGNTALEVGSTSSLMGIIHAKSGEYEKAIEKYEDALSIYRIAPLDQSLPIAKTLNHLGLAIIEADDDEYDDDEKCKSLQYLHLAQNIYEDKGKENSEEYAEVLFNVGSAHAKQDEIIEAITSYEDSLAVYCIALGRDHIKISVVLEKLGSCLIQLREHTEAMDVLKEALEVRKRHVRHNDLVTADIYFGMGIIHCESGKLNEALDHYEKSLKIRRSKLGESHVEVGQILNNIGSVFARNGEYQRAIDPWERAYKLYTSNGLEDDHPKVACTLGNIATSKSLISISQIDIESKLRKIEDW